MSWPTRFADALFPFPRSQMLVFTNARLIGQSDKTYTVTVDGGKITSIESAEVQGDAEVIDVGGRYLGPSLADAHTHFTAWTLNISRPNLAKATSAKEAIEIMRQEALKVEADMTPLVGRDLCVPHSGLLSNCTNSSYK